VTIGIGALIYNSQLLALLVSIGFTSFIVEDFLQLFPFIESQSEGTFKSGLSIIVYIRLLPD
jgi:hypothetical protein